jgi:hypothetical protein
LSSDILELLEDVLQNKDDQHTQWDYDLAQTGCHNDSDSHKWQQKIARNFIIAWLEILKQGRVFGFKDCDFQQLEPRYFR